MTLLPQDISLEQIGTNALIDLFRKTFLAAWHDPEKHLPALDAIVQELAQRPGDQKNNLYRHLRWNFLDRSVQEQRYEAAAIYRDMLGYYALFVLKNIP